ncbi:type I DNA specificity S subunit [Acetobacter senegalensis DSM 18889]|nr:type I DNA specificity S subunit [Acetobacter senegalensis DSM 18889]
MLPEGWESTTLGEIMDFRNGLNFSKSDSKNLIKVVGVSDFSLGNVLSRTDSLKETYVDQFKDDDLLQENDFLFVRSNGNKSLIGRCLYFPHIPEPISFSGFTIRGRLKNPLISATYIFQIVAGEYFRKYINLSGSGTNISNLSQEILSNTPLILPPLPEQKKIAAILSTWDRAIEGTEKLLANSQQQKKALMQQLLTGKKRLPGFTGEWRDLKLKTFLQESVIPSPQPNPRKRITVRLSLNGVEKREVRGTESIDATNYFTRKAGQFIYGKQNIHKGAFGIIPKILDGFETSQDIPCFDFLPNVCPAWFFYYFARENIHHTLETKMTGTGSKRLNQKTFLNLTCHAPPISEQQAIAAVLTTADAEITALESDLSRLRQEKKALMQQLLTGRRRVTVD